MPYDSLVQKETGIGCNTFVLFLYSLLLCSSTQLFRKLEKILSCERKIGVLHIPSNQKVHAKKIEKFLKHLLSKHFFVISYVEKYTALITPISWQASNCLITFTGIFINNPYLDLNFYLQFVNRAYFVWNHSMIISLFDFGCIMKLLFAQLEGVLVRILMKIMFAYEGPLFEGIAFWAEVRLFFLILRQLGILKIIFLRIVMEDKWQPSWKFLDRLIREFSPNIFYLHRLFGHSV